MAKLGAAGITSVLAIPSGDVMTGQSALVNVVAPPEEPQIGNVVDARRASIAIKAPVALHVTFPNRPRAGGNAYPESLIGVIAFVRQAFLDAEHYRDVAAHDSAARDGARRAAQNGDAHVDNDPALEAI